MKRFLTILAFLTLLSAPAHSQLKFSLPSCVGKSVWTPAGSGSEIVEIEYPGVVMYGWWCPGKTKPYVHVNVRINDRNTNATIPQLMNIADPLAALHKVIQDNERQARNDAEKALWIRAHAFGILYMQDKKPGIVYTHAVAPLTNATTRPASRVVNGVRTPIYGDDAPRVPIGTNCDLTIIPTFPSGSDVWAAVVGQAADLRWLCRKK